MVSIYDAPETACGRTRCTTGAGEGVTGGCTGTTARGAVTGGWSGRCATAADRSTVVVGVVVGGSVVVSGMGGATASAGGGDAAARCPLRPGKVWAAMAEKAPVRATPAAIELRVNHATRRRPASRAATAGSLGIERLSRPDLKER
jgi:hypothetical protein